MLGPYFGPPHGPVKRWWCTATIGALSVLPLACAMWSFTVDDAFIIARYAHHLATGAGYRFNAAGPISDGITPLGLPYLFAPFGEDAWVAYRAAKVVGLLAWMLGAGAMAVAVARLGGHRRRWAAWLLLAASPSLAAWSVAGMETGLVLGLAAGATAGRARGWERLAPFLAGMVGALRPEAVPWAVVLAVMPAAVDRPVHDGWRRGAIALVPPLLVAAARQVAFGDVVPLSYYAKPASEALGWRYAIAATLLTGVLATVARGPAWIRGVQAATAVHVVAMALAGGDWMPLGRFAVVLAPGVALVAAYAAGHSGPGWAWPRLAAGMAGPLLVTVTVAPKAARVEPKRRAVIEALAPALRGGAVAALDVGWVGLATSGTVVDLAGLTDPQIAQLPGGHTSKRIPSRLLEQRDVETVVLLLRGDPTVPWWRSPFARSVEHRLAALPEAEDFRTVAVSPPPLRYLVVRRRKPLMAPAR